MLAALAASCGRTSEDCDLLELAAPMHDTGKIGIPESILRKPTKLAAEVALHHHEEWDGSGYPNGLAGAAIPESAPIVALADVFDALATQRPYKQALPIDRVLSTINESSGEHFEPRLVANFNSILPQIMNIKTMWNSRQSE